MNTDELVALLDADDERTRKVGALVGAATEGPWVYVGRNVIDTPPIDVDEADWGPEGHSGLRVHTAQETRAYRYADAEFIAASRTETPWLVERLRARDAAIRAVLDMCDEQDDYEGEYATISTDRLRAALASALGGGEQPDNSPLPGSSRPHLDCDCLSCSPER